MESVKEKSCEEVHFKYEKWDENEEARAIIASFPSVIAARNATTSRCRLFKHCNSLNKAKAAQRKLVVNTEAKITYEGLLNNNSNNQYKQYVGVLNKKKKKLIVYDARFINLHLCSDEITVESQEKLEYKERNDLLIQAFGSVKGKRVIDNRKRNYEFKKSVSSTIGFAFEGVDREALEVKDISTANPLLQYLPHFHADASTPQDVFPWCNLISSQEMDALTSASSIFVQSTTDQVDEWTNKKTYPVFVLKRLSYLPTEAAERLRRCNFLIFVSYLITLFNLKARDLKKKDSLPLNTPTIIKASLFNKFTAPVADQKYARSMSGTQRDSLLYHCLIACLKIDDCDVLISDLKEDLKARDLCKYYRMMGCRLVAGKVVGKVGKECLRARLVLPYVLPDPPNKAAKRKRQ